MPRPNVPQLLLSQADLFLPQRRLRGRRDENLRRKSLKRRFPWRRDRNDVRDPISTSTCVGVALSFKIYEIFFLIWTNPGLFQFTSDFLQFIKQWIKYPLNS